jgi:hypothetical protein
MKKRLIAFLFAISACVIAGSVGAQSWTAANSGNPNPCSNNSGSGSGQCYCAQGYTYAYTQEAGENCNSYTGCWNPTGSSSGGGACFTCGEGGTISLGFPGSLGWDSNLACFGGINGQQNWNGAYPTVPSASGAACTQNSECQSYNALCTATNSSGVCTNWGGGPSSGGYSTNSDIRLKRDIVLLGQTEQGIKLYSFKYLSSDQVYVGVMAQDLLENPKWQDAVITNPTGYYSVIYSKLGLEMVTLEQYQQQSTVALVK